MWEWIGNTVGGIVNSPIGQQAASLGYAALEKEINDQTAPTVVVQTPAAAAPSALPGWALPVGIGCLFLLGVALFMKK
ncbi:MAG: hypothetical protein K9M45_01600 [Kiritimatiellales bacterium]|nr:hypothetical protein [Kiritimatiellales bacterium]